MDEGLYGRVFRVRLKRALAVLLDLEPDLKKVDPADQTCADATPCRSHCTSAYAERDPARRVAYANRLLQGLDQARTPSLRILSVELRALRKPPAPGHVLRYTTPPKTPLNDAALLTNAHGEPSLAQNSRRRSTRRIASTCCAHSSCGAVFGCSRGRFIERCAAECRSVASSPRPTSAGPSGRPSIAWSAIRRRGEGAVRRRAHATARQGVAVPPQHRLRHGVRRLVEPLDQRAARWPRVERPPLQAATPGAAAEVRGDLRLVLERLRVRAVRPGRDRDRLDDALHRGAQDASRRSSHALDLRASRSGPTPTSRRSSTPSRSSASSMTATATSSSPRPVPARPSSPRSTTTALRTRAASARRLLFVAHRTRDPRAVAADLPRGPGRRRLRRAVRRRRATGALASTCSPASSR